MLTRCIGVTALLIAGVSSVQSDAAAQLAVFTNETQFLAAAGNVPFESFEQSAPQMRGTNPISVPFFTVTPTPGLIGIQDGLNSPESGFGAFATDGSRYLFSYLPGLPTGTLRLDLNAPTTAFGFNIIDLGEADGVLTLGTNAGETLSALTLAQYPPNLGNGNVQFFGITQATPFTQVFLTATGVDDSYGLDKVYVRSVPEPGMAALLLSLGMISGSCFLRRRRRL